MNRVFFLFFLCGSFVSSVGICESQHRIVSLNPTLTEILFELGIGDQIVGTSTFSNYPEEAKKIPTIGSYLKPQIEKILASKPTLVLGFQEGDAGIKQDLERTNIRFYSFEAKKLKDFQSLVTDLGRLLNLEKQAEKIVKSWQNEFDTISAQKQNQKILIQVESTPLFIAGGDVFISEGLEKCGFINAYKHLIGFKSIQRESIIKSNIEFVLHIGPPGNLPDIKKFWAQVNANIKTFQGDSDQLSRLGPRFPMAIKNTCQTLNAR